MSLSFLLMGALTLKPSAYTFRPWEVISKKVPDFFDFSPTGLLFGIRGNRVVRVNKPDWLRDRVRFSYDGFRRQRLVKTYYNGHSIGLAKAIALWWSFFSQANSQLYLGPDANSGTGLLLLLLKRIGSFKGPLLVSIYSLNRQGACFYGPFGLNASALGLALPVQLDYEEINLFSSPPGVSSLSGLVLSIFQSFLLVKTNTNCLTKVFPKLFTMGSIQDYRFSRSVLQVSPLQRLLKSAAD